MNTKPIFPLLVLLGLTATAFPQGSLTPTSGPTPTMKRLDEVEPRTNLQGTPAPAGVDTSNAAYHFVITLPGSYYLTANLGVTKPNGILINAAGVTLDLRGFEIARTSGAGGNGIEIPVASHRAGIRHGSIKGFSYGIRSLQNAGEYARGCSFRDLAVSGCTTHGILAGIGAVLESCRAHDNSGNYAIVAKDGSTLINCTASKNLAGGISAEFGSSVTNCSASGNGGNGFLANIGCTISHCTARGNTSNGFILSTGSTIQGSTAIVNTGDGINVTDNVVVRDNTCQGNGNLGNGAGIHATSGSGSRIEGNNVTGNDRGINVATPGNLILKNSASGNTTHNYSIVADNRYGPIIDIRAAGSSAAIGSGTNPSTLDSTNAWANFSY